MSHYLNQCWNIVNWTLRNKFQGNFNRQSKIFIQENALKWRPFCVGLNVFMDLVKVLSVAALAFYFRRLLSLGLLLLDSFIWKSWGAGFTFRRLMRYTELYQCVHFHCYIAEINGFIRFPDSFSHTMAEWCKYVGRGCDCSDSVHTTHLLMAKLWKAAYGNIYIYKIDFKVASELGTLLLFQYV